MTGRPLDDFAAENKLSRRLLVTRATFFGAAMAAIGEVAKAQEAGSGSHSNAAIASPEAQGAAKTREEQIRPCDRRGEASHGDPDGSNDAPVRIMRARHEDGGCQH
jgi:hypothetical protein